MTKIMPVALYNNFKVKINFSNLVGFFFTFSIAISCTFFYIVMVLVP